jgi:hypothetical protein
MKRISLWSIYTLVEERSGEVLSPERILASQRAKNEILDQQCHWVETEAAATIECHTFQESLIWSAKLTAAQNVHFKLRFG